MERGLGRAVGIRRPCGSIASGSTAHPMESNPQPGPPEGAPGAVSLRPYGVIRGMNPAGGVEGGTGAALGRRPGWMVDDSLVASPLVTVPRPLLTVPIGPLLITSAKPVTNVMVNSNPGHKRSDPLVGPSGLDPTNHGCLLRTPHSGAPQGSMGFGGPEKGFETLLRNLGRRIPWSCVLCKERGMEP